LPIPDFNPILYIVAKGGTAMKRIILLFAFIPLLSFGSAASEPISSFQFRMEMHQLFHNYKGIFLAAKEENAAAAKAHVKLSRDILASVKIHIPDKDADGKTVNKKDFMARLDTLDQALGSVEKAFGAGARGEIAALPNKIFSICAGCHREAKLKYMFRLPEGHKLISEYMHSIAENYEMANIYLEEGERDEAALYLGVVNQMLSVLKRIFPDKGPTGIIMDRDRLVKQINEVEGYNLLIQEDIKSGKTENFPKVKQSLNVVCVACHEPDRIK